MQPDDRFILACPACDQPGAAPGRWSSFGAGPWLDSFLWSTLVLLDDEALRCGGCHALCWRSEAPVLEQCPPDEEPVRRVVVAALHDRLGVVRELRRLFPMRTMAQCSELVARLPAEVFVGERDRADLVEERLRAAGATLAPGVPHFGPDLGRFHTPTLRERIESVESLGDTHERARHLRAKIAIAINDYSRRGEIAIPLSREAIDQQRSALSALLDPGEHPRLRLLKAEVARERGRFDECLALLEGLRDGDLAKAAAQLRSLAHARDRALRQWL